MFLLRRFCVVLVILLFAASSICHSALPWTIYAERVEAPGLEARQDPGVVSAQDFLRRAWHTLAAVEGNYVYIDGGELAFGSGTGIQYKYSSSTLSIDLSRDWVNATVVLQSTNKPPGVPQLSYPSMWWDERDKLFYSGAIGRVSVFPTPDPPPLSLWSFKPDGTGSGTWGEVIPAGDAAWENLTRTTYGYQASDGNTALVLGGATTSKTSPETLDASRDTLQPGLLQFDMRTRRFTNSSATSFNTTRTGVYGQMHYVPFFGPSGLFLILGGEDSLENKYSLAEIQLYDAATHRWHNQTASGNVPRGRKDFCVAGVNSTEGTYEIFLYGGHYGNLGPEAVSYDEIYILTLPAFSWIKVQYPPQRPRGGHTCNAIGGGQIISIGGFEANSTIYQGLYEDVFAAMFNSTDPFAQGLGVFNMTSLAWEDHYTANAPAYVQSDLIRTLYADNPQDGSQFSTDELRELFKTTNFAPVEETPRPERTDTRRPDPPSDNTGAIAGGVVGGLAVFAVIAGIVFYFYRNTKRRSAAKQHADSHHDVANTTPGPQSPVHRLYEADPGAQVKMAQLEGQGILEMEHLIKMAQLEGRGIQEMEQQPTEMPAQVYFTLLAFLHLYAGNERSNMQQKSSIAGFNRDVPGGYAYGQSKAAATHLAKQMATQTVPYGIRANVITPGLYPSELAWPITGTSVFPKEKIPAERVGSEEDIVGTVLYMTSRAGAYLNGNVPMIDGGRLSVMHNMYLCQPIVRSRPHHAVRGLFRPIDIHQLEGRPERRIRLRRVKVGPFRSHPEASLSREGDVEQTPQSTEVGIKSSEHTRKLPGVRL
ncbi:MAG: hypothetical protein Q9171_005655 [Xanthocarpia ochracea]